MSPKRLRSSTKNQCIVQIPNGPSLLSLPAEIILHIASTYSRREYCGANYYCDEWLLSDDDEGDDMLHFERREALKALSQTCKVLRNLFLPQLWECFEAAYDPRDPPEDWVAFGAAKLERLSKGLVENPTLASHVRYVLPTQICQSECNAACQTESLTFLSWMVLLAHTLSPASSLSIIFTPFASLFVVYIPYFHPPDFRRSASLK